MELETALAKIGKVRQNFHIKRFNQKKENDKVFSGIKTLDKALMGFNPNKFYTIVARPGNGIYSFAHTLGSNIDVLYQTNYSIVLQKSNNKNQEPSDYWQFLNDNQLFVSGKETFSTKNLSKPNSTHRPVLLFCDVNYLNHQEIENLKQNSRKWWHTEVLVVFLYILENEESNTINLDDIPQSIKDNSDVIISLFRPAYYKIETWEDGTTTENQIEFSILKNDKPHHPKGRLFIAGEQHRVCSITNSFLNNWTKKFVQIINQ